MAEEIEPYILYRTEGGQAECAVWQLQQGPRALALFLSGDAATAYRQAARLDDDWKILQPARAGLLELLKTYYQAGVLYAVLDPDLEKAKRLFNLRDIVGAVE